MAARPKSRATARRGRAASRKAARKASARKPARQAAARSKSKPPTAKRKTVRRAGPSPAEALARQIVKVSNDPRFPFEQLYSEDCVSTEASGESFHGHAGLAQKMRNWEAMQESSTFRARNVLVKGNVICIEWEGTVKLRDGRTVALNEVAVHEVRGGKIARERYYYNPLAFAPPAPSPSAAPAS